MDKQNEPSLDEVMRRIWDTTEPDTDPVRNEQGRRRLERYIMRQRMVRWTRRIATAVAVSACLLLVGAGIYSNLTPDVVEQPTCFVLATSAVSPGEFTLPDGSHVWLNVSSRLEYTSEFTTGNFRDVKLIGEGYFEVQSDALRPFKVALEHISVEVLGTVFNVRSYSGEATEDVVLLSGAVKVGDISDGASVTLKPDERYCYDISTAAGSLTKVNARSYCQWFGPELIFDNTPLRDILVNLERRYGVKITMANEIDGNKSLSLVISDEPMTDVMTVLCSLIHCEYSVNGNNIVMTNK